MEQWVLFQKIDLDKTIYSENTVHFQEIFLNEFKEFFSSLYRKILNTIVRESYRYFVM